MVEISDKLAEMLQAPINMDHVTDDYKEDAAEKLEASNTAKDLSDAAAQAVEEAGADTLVADAEAKLEA